jgi:uncharacterized protein (TIGR00661 family)
VIIFVIDIMKKRILVAPLNWGLGHASRCIPVIRKLEQTGFIPVIASDGMSLRLLQKEFPHLTAVELPSYHITYPQNGRHFKLKMLLNTPALARAISAEKKETLEIIGKYDIDGIISDNRLGVYNKHIPSVIITHQLNVLTGNTTWLSSKIHQAFIKNFDECWVPDAEGGINLSGRLGHFKNHKFPVKYIGMLSSLSKRKLTVKYDLFILLSGPEPQRGLLEKKLKKAIKNFNGRVLFVKGKVEKEQHISNFGNVTVYNYMSSSDLENAFNESKLILCRSGYTTLMDLAALGKKAFLIPTPGQFEQEYLAKRLQKKGLLPSCAQNEFNISKLEHVAAFSGLTNLQGNATAEDLFSFFKRE